MFLIVGGRAFRFSVLIAGSSTVSGLFLLLFLLGIVETSHAVLVEEVDALRLRVAAIFEQRLGLDSLLIEVDDIEGASSAYGYEVSGKALVGRLGDFAFENV